MTFMNMLRGYLGLLFYMLAEMPDDLKCPVGESVEMLMFAQIDCERSHEADTARVRERSQQHGLQGPSERVK
jgi:hypothetical protein